jgi:hypothetical protein
MKLFCAIFRRQVVALKEPQPRRLVRAASDNPAVIRADRHRPEALFRTEERSRLSSGIRGGLKLIVFGLVEAYACVIRSS